MLNVVYALLIEHGSQEQIDEIDKTLDAPTGGAGGHDPEREQAVLASLTGMFAANE